MHVRPFHIAIDDKSLTDLRTRLAAVKWPLVLDAQGWDDGAGLALLRELGAYWRDTFDWRAMEARLNRLPQFVAEVDQLAIHFVHQKGRGPAPLPLMLTHGWPGSFVEMEEIIPLLADPASHGGDAVDAFDVIVPSLPGYAFSQAPSQQGVGPHAIAALWRTLMAGLGYDKFGLQGGDIGASVSSWLAYRFPENVIALHLNYIPGGYRPPLGDGQPPISVEEQAFLDTAAAWADAEGAYAHQHGTKPQTLAYALTDSPIGLAAWMVEKFRAWSDNGGDVRKTFSFDDLLTGISLYWFSGSLAASLRLYKESRQRPLRFANGDRVMPPLAVAQFPHELPMPPRSWVERCYNVARWTKMPRGGHSPPWSNRGCWRRTSALSSGLSETGSG